MAFWQDAAVHKQRHDRKIKTARRNNVDRTAAAMSDVYLADELEEELERTARSGA